MQGKYHFIFKSKYINGGFTLIEAMVVVAIMTISLAVAIPSMSGLLHDSRISSNVNEFIAAVTLARVEAVKRGRLVTICRSSNADTASPTCDSALSDWSSGWLVFEEGSNSLNVGTYESTETLIARRGALPLGTLVPASPSGTAKLTFNSLGEPVGESTGMFGFNFSVKGQRAREVCISRNGRVKVIPGATSAVGC
jgi:type IV fimbrial biogenesis protein FimT